MKNLHEPIEAEGGSAPGVPSGAYVRQEQFRRVMNEVATAFAGLLEERNQELYSKIANVIESAGFEHVAELFDQDGVVVKNAHVDAVTYTIGVVALTDYYIKELEKEGPPESQVDWLQDVEYSQLVDNISEGLNEIGLDSESERAK